MTQPQRGTTGQRALMLAWWLKAPWKRRSSIHGWKAYLSHHGRKLSSYHLSAGSGTWASCELCPLWCCSSRHRCSYPRQRAPPWQCKGFLFAGRRNAGCLVEQSMGTHWRPMHKSGLEDKQRQTQYNETLNSKKSNQWWPDYTAVPWNKCCVGG